MQEQTAYTKQECLEMLRAFGNYFLILSRVKNGEGRSQFLKASQSYDLEIPERMRDELRAIQKDLESVVKE